MSEAKVLLQQTGPNGNIQAVVEDDGRAVYLYLEGPEGSDWPIRSCWVRNRKTAPALIEAERISQGLAPMLPARYCAHPDGAAPLREDELELLWFEEGESVALLERGDVLAVIPPWMALGGAIGGYSRDCVLAGPLAEPLGAPTHDHHGIFARLAKAAHFWESWDHNPWPAIQEGLMQAAEAALGPHSRYLSTPAERWPPRSLSTFEGPTATVILTGGMSLRPQPQVERHISDLAHRGRVRRIELALALPAEQVPEDPMPLLSYVNGQSTLPWDRWTFLDEGHTIGSKVLPAPFTAVVLWRDPPGAPAIDFPPFEGEPVQLLWMVPITEVEQALGSEEGGAALLDHLRGKGVGWLRSTQGG